MNNMTDRMTNGRIAPQANIEELAENTARHCQLELASYLRRKASEPRLPEEAKPHPATGLSERLCSAVLGQEAAIQTVSEAVDLRTLGLELRDGRPLVFLFCGPTGVGKTELAHALAKELYPTSDRLLRIDCSEYSEAHQVARLLGAPPSYVGYGNPSPLEAFLKKDNAGVLLLDEFEKGNPALHRLFLQAFDAGRLTNSSGKTLDLSRLTIIATTNAGMQTRAAVGFGIDASRDGASISVDRLREVFPIELLNRFDALIPFRHLSKETTRQIVAQHLIPKAATRLREAHGKTLTVTTAAQDLVITRGYSKEFGARNLQRVFESLVMKKIATHLRSGVGCRDVVVDVSGVDTIVRCDVPAAA